MKTLTYADYKNFEQNCGPFTKAEALAKLASFGYKVYGTGQCGDGGHGTRQYLKRDDAVLNEYGQPQQDHATISKLPNGWYISVFNTEFFRQSEAEYKQRKQS